ncbi:MAG TPA: MmcQ/YjbR family DNA-binding protein [Opitutaceae bacterium]
MRLSALRDFALSLPQTTSVKQWGDCLVFKVAGKVFLVLGLDAETIDGVTFKCKPDEFDDLLDIDGATQAPYFAKRHWVRLGDATAVPLPKLQALIRHSYDLVVEKLPKKVQASLKT